MRTTRLLLAALLAAVVPAWAQDAKPAEPKPDTAKAEEAKPEALPPGETKVLQAIVMEVKGTAQARADREGGWADLKVNDVLSPGTVIRTGRDSHVALRVGMNATVLVERQTRVALPEIVQNGEVLRTRVAMSFGRADVRVDRIGLRNDFEVATPTATLAVRGTAWLMTWDTVKGFRAVGVRNNRLRAIELAYLNGVETFLSGADESSTTYQLPALAAFFETYIAPLKGAVSTDEGNKGTAGDPTGLQNPRRSSETKAADRQRGGKLGRDPSGGNDNPPPPTDGQ